MHVACLLHLHSAFCAFGACMHCAAVGSRPFDRRLEPPPFSSWLGYLPSFFCARLTHVFGTAFQESYGTHWRMSPSPRDRRTGAVGPDVPAPWHGGGGEEAGRGAGNPLRPAPGTMVPPPGDGGWQAERELSPLENEWDRQDQWRWFSRDDPPPLQQPELLKWRHWRPGKIREMEPTTQRALELHMRGKWAERLLAHFAPFAEHIAYMQDILGEDFRKEALDLLGEIGSGHSGNIAWSTRVSGREASQ